MRTQAVIHRDHGVALLLEFFGYPALSFGKATTMKPDNGGIILGVLGVVEVETTVRLHVLRGARARAIGYISYRLVLQVLGSNVA